MANGASKCSDMATRGNGHVGAVRGRLCYGIPVLLRMPTDGHRMDIRTG